MGSILPGVVSESAPINVVRNYSMAAQALAAATEAIIDGSQVVIPDSGLVAGSVYKVKLALDKTGAGTATSAYKVGLVDAGDAVTVANVKSVLSFTKPAGTAAADEGVVEIVVFIKDPGDSTAESGSVLGEFVMGHNLAATGHATVPVVVLYGEDTSTATVLAGQNGGSLVLTVTTGAADVSSVHWAEATLTQPAASGG